MTRAQLRAPHGGAAVPGALRGGRLAARPAARARAEGRRLPRARPRRRGAARALPRARPRRRAARRRAARGRALLAAAGGRARASRSCRRGASTPIAPGEPDYTGNPHTDFRIEPDPELPVRRRSRAARLHGQRDGARRAHAASGSIRSAGATTCARGVLRVVHATAFRDDPLRILRGVARCSARRPASPTTRTRELMTAAAPRIAELSAERVREELERILAGDGAAAALRLARDVGALAVAVPEWAPCIGFDQQSKTQAYTLDEHILHVLDAAVHDGAAREPRLAAFWHDVGKPHASGATRARRGRRAPSPRAALRRLTYDNDTVATVGEARARAPLRRGPGAQRASARVFLARVGRDSRPRPPGAAPLGSSRPRRADPGRADRRARALRGARRAGVGAAGRARRSRAARRRPDRSGRAGGPGASARRCDGCWRRSSTTPR